MEAILHKLPALGCSPLVHPRQGLPSIFGVQYPKEASLRMLLMGIMAGMMMTQLMLTMEMLIVMMVMMLTVTMKVMMMMVVTMKEMM